MDFEDTETVTPLPSDFQQAANPAAPVIAPPRVMVSLPLDADLLAFFQADTEPAGWQAHINGVLRYYVETNQARASDFEAAMSDAPELLPVG